MEVRCVDKIGMNNRKKVTKGKIISEKKLNLAIGINTTAFIVLIIMAIYATITKDYNSLISILVVGGVVIFNFYRLYLRIKERKMLKAKGKI